MYFIWSMFLNVCCSDCVVVCGNVCCVADVVKDILSLWVLRYVVCLCKGCDGCCVFVCIVRSCRCLCMRSMSVSSCRCCKFVSSVHPFKVLYAVFCMTCRLLMLVEDAKDDHIEEAYSRAGLRTALYAARSVSCLTHHVAVSAFIICSSLCACTEMFWMCVLYVCFGFKVWPRTFGCVAMHIAVVFIYRSRYSYILQGM